MYTYVDHTTYNVYFNVYFNVYELNHKYVLSTRELSAGLRQALSRMDYLLIVPPLAGDSEQLSAPERSEGRAGMLARGELSPRTTQISYNTTHSV